MNPKEGEAWFSLGLVNLKLGQLGDAEAAMKKLTEVAPKMPEAWDFLKIIYGAQDRDIIVAVAKDKARELRG
ncbi:MAG: hypothetical protein ACXADS_13835 [Candidatus Thorarchaeota archaeon]